MRYFFENLVGLQPQNLIPEVIWAALAAYLLTLGACYSSLFKGHDKSMIRRAAWTVILLIPFIGPIAFAAACIGGAETGWKEFLKTERSES